MEEAPALAERKWGLLCTFQTQMGPSQENPPTPTPRVGPEASWWTLTRHPLPSSPTEEQRLGRDREALAGGERRVDVNMAFS